MAGEACSRGLFPFVRGRPEERAEAGGIWGSLYRYFLYIGAGRAQINLGRSQYFRIFGRLIMALLTGPHTSNDYLKKKI